MSVSSGTGSLGWSRTKGRKMVVVVVLCKCLHNMAELLCGTKISNVQLDTPTKFSTASLTWILAIERCVMADDLELYVVCIPLSPVSTIQPVVKPVSQLVVSCIQTFNWLSNLFDKWLCCVYRRLSIRLYNPV